MFQSSLTVRCDGKLEIYTDSEIYAKASVIRVLSGAKVVTSIMPGFGYGPCGQHKIMLLQDELLTGKPLFPGKNVVHQLDLMTDLLGAPCYSQVKALNEIKSTFGWRVGCAWIGNDPCRDGYLPACLHHNALHKITVNSVLGKYDPQTEPVVEQMFLIATARCFLAGIKKNNVEWAEGSDEAVVGDQEIAVTSGCGMHFHGHHYGLDDDVF
ncbi:hypothetical protein Tco_0950243 [Tanacetum coccineum]